MRADQSSPIRSSKIHRPPGLDTIVTFHETSEVHYPYLSALLIALISFFH